MAETNGNGARPFATVTLGNLLAAIPAVITLVGAVIWATTQGNINDEQSRAIDLLTANSFTKAEASSGRALRDAQIKGVQDSIMVVQSGITGTLALLSARMDRAFERLDAIQTTVIELKTTIGFLQQQQLRPLTRRFDEGQPQVPPDPGRTR